MIDGQGRPVSFPKLRPQEGNTTFKVIKYHGLVAGVD